MKAFTLGAAITLVFSTAAYAQAPTWTVPEESQRCPSKWGAADERGSGNHQKPAAVMNAAKLIKTGEVFELAHVLGPSMAFFGTRRFDVHTKRTFMNQFSNMRGSNEEVVISSSARSARSSTALRTRPISIAGTIARRSTRTPSATASRSSASTMSARCSRAAS